MKKLIFLITFFLVTSSLDAMEQTQEEFEKSLDRSWVLTDAENPVPSGLPLVSSTQPHIVVYNTIPEIKEDSPEPLSKSSPLEAAVSEQIHNSDTVEKKDDKMYTQSTFKTILEIVASYRLHDNKKFQFAMFTTTGICITAGVIGLAYKLYKK